MRDPVLYNLFIVYKNCDLALALAPEVSYLNEEGLNLILPKVVLM